LEGTLWDVRLFWENLWYIIGTSLKKALTKENLKKTLTTKDGWKKIGKTAFFIFIIIAIICHGGADTSSSKPSYTELPNQPTTSYVQNAPINENKIEPKHQKSDIEKFLEEKEKREKAVIDALKVIEQMVKSEEEKRKRKRLKFNPNFN
jgi:hypothetical protein